jgi:hypothetical protein
MVRTRLLVASVMVGGLLAIGGIAGATPTTSAIGPNQHFVGLVNKKSTKAVIKMACPGPLSTVSTGHPLGGQTVAVEPPSTVAGTSGYTGTRGHLVVASFVTPTEAIPITITGVTFTRYGSQPIPTSLSLPCSGSGDVLFMPEPPSTSARSATVSVTYENITVDPPPATEATASRTIVVTQADTGHSYRLHKGDLLDVQLTEPSGVIWTEPASSNQAVLQRTGGSSGTTATGTFVAGSHGKAQVTALGTPNCTVVCPDFIVAFEVSVTVVG